MGSPKSLYVHIPFCASICSYCDFPKVIYRQTWAEDYLRSLFIELDSLGDIGLLDTIYIGGGTPNCLPIDLLESLLKRLEKHLKPDGEFSIEANPEFVSKEQGMLFKKYRVNRVSIGMQSSRPELLKLCNRRHDFAAVMRAVKTLRGVGINNISLDLIYALPNETKEQALEDVAKAVSLNPDHISAYSLILEDGTSFKAKGIVESSQEIQAEQYEAVRGALEEAGYRRYEFSSFAKDGKKCRHNLVYWRDEQYYAIGMGASGYVDNTRFKNTSNLHKYLEGERKVDIDEVTPKEDREYFFLTNLRLEEGFAISDFNKRFNADFEKEYAPQIAKLQDLTIIEDGRFKLKPEKLILLDSVLIELF
ncbi:MAG: radical SAM family heme chaperone HemW [Bacilli bacterium]|nr:radical SAM family heme chaperone HemW [Bacilli bacterium]